MRYRILGRSGLRVSELALGTGNFGTGWGYGSTKEEVEGIFGAYRATGVRLRAYRTALAIIQRRAFGTKWA